MSSAHTLVPHFCNFTTLLSTLSALHPFANGHRDYGFIIPGNPNDRIVVTDELGFTKLNGESFREALGLNGKCGAGRC